MKAAHRFHGIIGETPVILNLLDQLKAAADCDATILLSGESGVGKTLLAEEIHRNSRRMSGPFIEVNCGAIPESLIENELFGHEKGAFTDAREKKTGYFEQADGGTLLLDEIGTMSPPLQSRFLKVLDTRKIKRVGAEHEINVDVRIIAATNIALKEAIGRNAFRKDLYYRLNVFPIGIPPLRERKGDIPLLVTHFLNINCRKYRKQIPIPPDAIEYLQSLSWPGNVRQLASIIERAVIMTKRGTPIGRDMLSRWLSAVAEPETPEGRPESFSRTQVSYDEGGDDAGKEGIQKENEEAEKIITDFLERDLVAKAKGVKGLSAEAYHCLLQSGFLLVDQSMLEDFLEKLIAMHPQGNSLIERETVESTLKLPGYSGPENVFNLLFNRLSFNEAVAWVEKKKLQQALLESRGNISRAAKILNIHRDTVRKKIDVYKIQYNIIY